MIENTLQELIDFLEKEPGSRPKVIAEELGISRQYVQKLLANNENLFSVSGAGPNRFYRNKNTSIVKEEILTNFKDSNLIEENFYALTPLGEELVGVSGFKRWCDVRNFDFDAKKNEYITILKKYYKNDHTPIDFTNKLETSFADNVIKKVWAVDYYNFEIFGKTKMGTQVMIAKQTGDSSITNQLISRIDPVLDNMIEKFNIEAVAFVSPTIQRQSQLMTKLDNNIAIDIPRIKVHKVGAKILIAQKTLKSLEDRILNASETFVVESQKKYNNVLIIDDALGSGATLNELAKQILQKGIAKTCYGLVLVASPSGYEVINEV